MTKARHIGVARYLTTEGALPYATAVHREVFGQPVGAALALPAPFECAVVTGRRNRGIGAWAKGKSRIMIYRNPKENDLDNLVCEVPLRVLAELTRGYYEGGK